jgi:hypothetical protein
MDNRTTIVSSTETQIVEQKLAEFLARKGLVLMIIIGDFNTNNKSIDRANQVANASEFGVKRWVLHLPNPELLQDKLIALLENSNIPKVDQNFDNLSCFCLSHIRQRVGGIVYDQGYLKYQTLINSFNDAQNIDVNQQP